MNLLKMQQAFGRLVRDPSKQLISLNGFSKGSAEHTRYNRDWLQQHEGTAELVVKPETSEEVSAILRTANAERIPIHIQGGNTGLVGGSIALNGTAMLLSMDRMSKILNFDSSSGVVHCEAGAVLQNLHTHVEERGFRFPLDLGAKGSCQIGGNLATAAGGTRYCSMGSFHQNLVGLQWVQADGTIVSDLASFPKNNTGLHLRQMLVGSEGILGVITEAMVQCHPLRKHARVCFLSLRTDATMDCVRMLIERAKRHSVSQFIAAFELIDSKCMDLHQSLYPESAIFSQVQIGAYNVLMECEYDDEDYLDQHVNDFLASEMEGGLLADGVVSQNQKQAKEMWGIRESITTNLVHDKSKTLYKFDVSVHLEHLPMLQDRLAGHGLEVFYFGHLFDLNTHINILTPEPQPEGKIEGLVYEAVHECGGSFSAEHGIGAVKKKYLQQYDVKNQCSTLMLLKKAMDPHNILNPGVMV